MNAGRIAILIDGSFFLKRLPKLVGTDQCNTTDKIVSNLKRLCQQHIYKLAGKESGNWRQHVYRIFFYDAAPYDGKAHHPIDNKLIDYGKSDIARDRLALFDKLRQQRKLALRLGKVTREHDWSMDPGLTKKMLKTRTWAQSLQRLTALPENGGTTTLTLSAGEVQDLIRLHDFWSQIDNKSVRLGLRQKGVDMRIAIDIASLTLKKQVDAIILVSGDSDFVPAAKMARREGIEIILDPMWQKINADLFEHIDGLQSGLGRDSDNPEGGNASDDNNASL